MSLIQKFKDLATSPTSNVGSRAASNTNLTTISPKAESNRKSQTLFPPSNENGSSSSTKHVIGLSDLQILQTVGTGSFGRVHLVRFSKNGKYYAMKVLKKSEIVRMKQVEHTVNEKNILEKLHHPFLISMLGSFQDCVNLYMVLDYVSGGELFTYLRRNVRFPNHVARFYAAEVTSAFEYLHEKDIM